MIEIWVDFTFLISTLYKVDELALYVLISEIVHIKYLLIVRGPVAEPGKWVQSFFLNVFILYRYCTI